MRFRSLRAILVVLFAAVTGLSDAISITINPFVAREFVDKYTITCQYSAPAAGNTSTTGVLRITHMTNSEVVYSYDFYSSQEIISSTMKRRSVAYLNQTTTTVVLQVNVAVATDSGLYNCSLTDTTSAYYVSAITPIPLNVSGCANGSLVKYVSQCSSLQNGDPCSITCISSDVNAMVSLSRSYDGSSPLISNVSEINYTRASVGDADYGTYYCYVKAATCTSMKESAITPFAVTTTPAKDANGTDCSSGCPARIPGWGIALIVIACVVVVVIIILIILFFLHKKGLFRRKEGEVQPDNTRRAVANDNFAMANDANERCAKGAKKDKKSNETTNAQPMNFPEVKTRKNILPPLTGNLRASTENDHSPDGPTSGRPLPKRRASNDENSSPDGRRRSSLGRRQSIEDGSPDRGNKLPSIRGPTRDYDDEDNDRF